MDINNRSYPALVPGYYNCNVTRHRGCTFQMSITCSSHKDLLLTSYSHRHCAIWAQTVRRQYERSVRVRGMFVRVLTCYLEVYVTGGTAPCIHNLGTERKRLHSRCCIFTQGEKPEIFAGRRSGERHGRSGALQVRAIGLMLRAGHSAIYVERSIIYLPKQERRQ